MLRDAIILHQRGDTEPLTFVDARGLARFGVSTVMAARPLQAVPLSSTAVPSSPGHVSARSRPFTTDAQQLRPADVHELAHRSLRRWRSYARLTVFTLLPPQLAVGHMSAQSHHCRPLTTSLQLSTLKSARLYRPPAFDVSVLSFHPSLSIRHHHPRSHRESALTISPSTVKWARLHPFVQR